MPKLRLSYFDFPGGRGETPRIALSIGGIAFEDHRIKFADWPKFKPETPFGSVPVLSVDGVNVAQSVGITCYVGKLSGLYPEDPLQALYCDEPLGAIEELAVKFGKSLSMEEDEKKAFREAFVPGPLTQFLKGLASQLGARGGEYFADGCLTVADLRFFVWMRHLRSGKLDYVPTDLAEQVAPLLVAHFERVNSDPRVQAYYEKQ